MKNLFAFVSGRSFRLSLVCTLGLIFCGLRTGYSPLWAQGVQERNILSIDLKKGQRERFDVRAIIRQIVRFNEILYLGTSEGIFLFQDGKCRQIRYDMDIDGQYFLRMD
jgi:hypothetical protein